MNVNQNSDHGKQNAEAARNAEAAKANFAVAFPRELECRRTGRCLRLNQTRRGRPFARSGPQLMMMCLRSD